MIATLEIMKGKIGVNGDVDVSATAIAPSA
jgi:hypothetical protein